MFLKCQTTRVDSGVFSIIIFTHPTGVTGCGSAEVTSLGSVCFVFVLSANRVDFRLLFVSNVFQFYSPPPLKAGLGLFLLCVFIIFFLFSFSIGCSCMLLLVFFFICLEFQIILFVISTSTPIFFIEISLVFLPPPPTLE